MKSHIARQVKTIQAMKEQSDNLEMMLRIESLKKATNRKRTKQAKDAEGNIPDDNDNDNDSIMAHAAVSRAPSAFPVRQKGTILKTAIDNSDSDGFSASLSLPSVMVSSPTPPREMNRSAPQMTQTANLSGPPPNDGKDAQVQSDTNGKPPERPKVTHLVVPNYLEPPDPNKKINYTRRMSQGLIQLGEQRFNKFGETMEEKAKDKRGFKGLHPLSTMVAVWDFFILFPYTYILLLIPAFVAFSSLDSIFLSTSIVITILLTMDTTLRLFILRPALEEDKWLDFHSSLKQNAASLSFTLDLISSIPFELVLYADADRGVYPQLLFSLKLLRMHRYSSLLQTPYQRKIAQSFRNTFNVGMNFMAINTFLLLMGVFIHYHCCLLFYIPRITGHVDYLWKSMGILTMPPSKQYTWGFWAAIANTVPMTSNYRPDSDLSQWGGSFLTVVSALLLATFTGIVAAFSAGEVSPAGRFRQRIDEVNEYIIAKEMNDELAAKIRDYFNFKYRGKIFNQDGILSNLNERIQEEIQLHNWCEMLMQVPFLNPLGQEDTDHGLFAQIASSMVECFFVGGDTIFSQGEHGDCMYFIITGSVAVIVDNKKVGGLKSGSYFGEMALMAVIPRTATIVAESSCKCARLDRDSVMQVLLNFPEIAGQMKAIFMERLSVLQSMKL
ncbi:anaphase-promoting complex subunit Hcn1 [Phlyctochytrium bullatum]|nr:anaphase-promoting complex subunit Hcn1 [Phlyctochytrium bullatum]